MNKIYELYKEWRKSVDAPFFSDAYKSGYMQAIQDVLVAIEDAVNYCNCTGEIQNLIKEEK